MSFTTRRIDLTFQLGKGNFGESGYDTVKVTGLRVRADITQSNGPSMGEARVRVYGLTMDIMNRLAIRIPSPEGVMERQKNNLIIDAGDDEVGMARVFQGEIILAPIDMSDAPSSSLVVVAQAGAFEAVKQISISTYPGSADVAIIMQGLAAQAGYAFESDGVSVIMATPYLWGSLRDQMAQAANAANINWTVDIGPTATNAGGEQVAQRNTLAIWPKNGTRGGQVPVISAKTGMVGYPTNWGIGVAVKSIFNPLLRLGGQFDLESMLKFANGRFNVFDIGHELESEVVGGVWFTSFHGSPSNNGEPR